MKHLFALTAICALLSAPVMAQTTAPAAGAEEPVDVNAAIKTITEFTADEKKVSGYCAISKEMAAVKEGDTAKMEELGQKMDTYLTGLGEQYADALSAAEGVAPESEDGKKLDTVLGALEAKCGA
jgi:cell pole-organizing protein PopZ